MPEQIVLPEIQQAWIASTKLLQGCTTALEVLEVWNMFPSFPQGSVEQSVRRQGAAERRSPEGFFPHREFHTRPRGPFFLGGTLTASTWIRLEHILSDNKIPNYHSLTHSLTTWSQRNQKIRSLSSNCLMRSHKIWFGEELIQASLKGKRLDEFVSTRLMHETGSTKYDREMAISCLVLLDHPT